MIRVAQLFRSEIVRVERCDHPLDVPHVDPPEEQSTTYSINFIESGRFSVASRGRSWTLGARDLFITAPGMVYRCAHDGRPDDVCLCVCFEGNAHDAGMNMAPLRDHTPVASMTNRRAYLRARLARRMAENDAVAVDLIAGELLEAIYRPSNGAAPHRLFGAAQLSWYTRRIDMVREQLDADYASAHSLTALARSAGMSPFHFARVFRDLVGVPPHRYLLSCRLRAAADRLRGGDSVTGACFETGFNSLGHFIEMFRRAYGVSPSRFARNRKRAHLRSADA
jgi:AraC-like DNA-binding protein